MVIIVLMKGGSVVYVGVCVWRVVVELILEILYFKYLKVCYVGTDYKEI